MGRVDSFFKAYEQEWFWALAEMLQLGLIERHPDRPEPVAINPENIKPPTGLPISDMFMEVKSAGGKATYVLFENTVGAKADHDSRMVRYIHHFVNAGYWSLITVLVYVTEEDAPKDAAAVEVVTHEAEPVGMLGSPWCVRYLKIVLAKVLPPIEEAPAVLLPLYMVQQPRKPTAAQVAALERLLAEQVVPKLEQARAEFGEEKKQDLIRLVEYTIWGLAARNEKLAQQAVEVVMSKLKVDYKDHPYFHFGHKEGREEGRIAEQKRTLLRQGRRRFGEPDSAQQATVEAINDTATLERLLDRVLDAEDWATLLADE